MSKPFVPSWGYGVPVVENFGDIPDSEKTGFYYTIVSLSVFATVISTLFSAAFLLMSIVLWSHFRPVKFFWFLTQLTITVFVLSTANLLVNVPATLHLLSVDGSNTAIFYVFTWVIDFCHYAILFSNVVIAIQRGFFFFLRGFVDKIFDSPFIYLWLLFIWVLSVAIEITLLYFNCFYVFKKPLEVYVLECVVLSQNLNVNTRVPAGILIIDTTLQIILPLFVFGIYLAIIIKILYLRNFTLKQSEVSILKQAVFVYVAFQSSSLVFLLFQHFKITPTEAFLVKRFVNAMEIIAGAATPTFFFFTSKDIRKLMTVRVSASSSSGGLNVQARGTLE